MPKPDDLEVSRLLVSFIRAYARLSQAQLAEASRVSQPNISLYEKGKAAPSEATLRRLGEAAGLEWRALLHVRGFIEFFLAAASERKEAAMAEPLDLAVLEPVLLAVAPALLAEREEGPRRRTEEEERREAEEIWAALERFDVARRRRLIEQTLEASRSAALAMRICDASARAADGNSKEALELAELAYWIAQRVPGEASGHVQGYCLAYVLSSRRAVERLGGVG
jgi:transcriptional regulator with XRE-family HTH domain